jgi:hypothetical protein
MLVIRFPTITEGIHPLAVNGLNWFDLTADPEYLSSAKPVPVQARELLSTSSTTELGYLPAGWQWRTDHDVIGQKIYSKNSFPYMRIPTTQQEAKYAHRIKDAFRSQALDDYMVDLYFKEESYQPIGTSMESYFSGMLDDAKHVKNTNDEFPKGGKML